MKSERKTLHMSISSAMQTGVTGLQAMAASVGKISENIANVQTDGYRRSFSQMVTRASDVSSGEGGATVRAVTARDIGSAGPTRTTGRATDLAIGGQGFFVVAGRPGETSEANFMLTRAGAFEPDEDGFLKNAAGNFLMGFPYDAAGTIGAVDRTRFGDLQAINVKNAVMKGAPTTAIGLSGNLPSQATGLATPGAPFVSSATYYSPIGEAGRIEFTWQPGAAPNLWSLTVANADGTLYGGMDVEFNGSGPDAGSPAIYSAITDLSGTGAFAADPLTGQITLTLPTTGVPGATQAVTVDLGAPNTFSGLSQFSGNYQPIAADVDGSQYGVLIRTEIDDKGDVIGVFDNGLQRSLFRIPVAMVDSPNNLNPLDGNAYALSWSSGGVVLNDSGENGAGGVMSGSLEGSNVEIAEELTNLITFQRAYSSNAKIITTADEMLDETLRIKR